MKKQTTLCDAGRGAYAAPVCKVLDVHVQGYFCQSWGDPNAPGGPLTEDNIYNY